MAFTGTSVINAALADLGDPGGITWTRALLFGWIAEAMRAVVMLVPSAYQVRGQLTLSGSDYVQQLPVGAVRLIKITKNLGVDGLQNGPRASPASEEQLSRVDPNWTRSKPGPWIRNYCIDPETPGFFYVSPRPAGALKVEAIWSAAPPPTSAEGTNLPLDDIYQDAVKHYLVQRAYNRNASVANTRKAAEAGNRMRESLGLKRRSDYELDPAPRAKQAA